jgi:hypothetical protein
MSRGNISDDGQWFDNYQSQECGLQGVTDARMRRGSFIYPIDATEPYGRGHDKAISIYRRQCRHDDFRL